MTTNCDLEEMKHIAQQKFIELVDSGVVFVSDITNYGMVQYVSNGFAVGNPFYSLPGGLKVELMGETIWQRMEPEMRHVKRNKDGKYNKADFLVAMEELSAAMDEYNADPMVIAARRVISDYNCRQIQSALESSCKALQEALKDTATTPAPQVQTGNTEPYSGSERPCKTYPTQRRYWWQFWRGL